MTIVNATATKGGFDPAIHLVPASTYDGMVNPKITMKELGFPPSSLSEVRHLHSPWLRQSNSLLLQIGATHPFPLFTVEAIRRFREEAVDHDTLSKHMYRYDLY